MPDLRMDEASVRVLLTAILKETDRLSDLCRDIKRELFEIRAQVTNLAPKHAAPYPETEAEKHLADQLKRARLASEPDP